MHLGRDIGRGKRQLAPGMPLVVVLDGDQLLGMKQLAVGFIFVFRRTVGVSADLVNDGGIQIGHGAIAGAGLGEESALLVHDLIQRLAGVTNLDTDLAFTHD